MSTPSQHPDQPQPERGPHGGPDSDETRNISVPPPQYPQQGASAPPPNGQQPYGEYGRPGQTPYGAPYSSGPSTGQYAQYPQNPYAPQNAPYGQPGYGQPGYGQPTQPPGGVAYNPYGAAPAGAGHEAEPRPVRRPGTVTLALVLLVLSALPFLVGGIAALFVPISEDLFPAQLGLPQLLSQYNVTFDAFVQAVRLVMALVATLALIYVVLAALAFGGKNWARIVTAVLTGLFTVVMLLNVAGAGDLASLLVIVVPIVLAVAGTVLLFVGAAGEWFASRRH